MFLTALYVPGDRPKRFAKAAASGADAVVLDLEDAVLPAAKPAARAAVVAFLGQRPADLAVQVRVNARSSGQQVADLTALAGATGLTDVRLSTVEGPDDVTAVAAAVGPHVGLHAVVENAAGIEALAAVARCPGVVSVQLGEADLGSQLGLRGEEAFAPLRSRLVVACAAAGLPSPMLSVYPDLADREGLVASCRSGRDAGFVGRSVVHPRQVAAVVEGFRPSADELERAGAVLAALGSGDAVSVVGGRMVDAAMAGAARRVLELARACAAYDDRIATGASDVPSGA